MDDGALLDLADAPDARVRLNALWYSALETVGAALHKRRDPGGDHFQRLTGRFRRAFAIVLTLLVSLAVALALSLAAPLAAAADTATVPVTDAAGIRYVAQRRRRRPDRNTRAHWNSMT